ncbi:hypothetical protein BGX34_001657 [Mortierella sp. NVP85]|nr:hypothetical protein BGX34_001657 [Mortierella sp. NVP85]
MVKLQLLALAAIATVSSAIEVYEHPYYDGYRCDVPSVYEHGGTCFPIPSSCKGRVSSVRVRNLWTCKLYENAGCGGGSTDVYGDVPSLSDRGFDDRAFGVKCWFYA